MRRLYCGTGIAFKGGQYGVYSMAVLALSKAEAIGLTLQAMKRTYGDDRGWTFENVDAFDVDEKLVVASAQCKAAFAAEQK